MKYSSSWGGAAVAVFNLSGETGFYAQCIEHLVFAASPLTVAEFGSGSGDAVIIALAAGYTGSVFGVEVDGESAKRAKAAIAAAGLERYYEVTLGDFLSHPPQADCLIANPPYMPSCSDESARAITDPTTLALLRQCDGGPTGAELSQKLLGLNYRYVMMLVSSHARPLAILRTAREYGYSVVGWLCRPFTFGPLHTPVEPVIQELLRAGQAFVLPESKTYLVAGVLWLRAESAKASDTERALVCCIKGLESTGYI